MNNRTLKTFADALSLPSKSRAELARRLLLSLEEEPFDDNPDSAWRNEIRRRANDMRSGKVKTISAEKALAKAFQHLDKPKRSTGKK